jgi:hypothetical protein
MDAVKGVRSVKKRVLSLILVCLLCACMTVAVSAAGENTPCVVDHANLLSDSELAGLTRDLEAVARKYGVELAVVTVNSSEGLSHRRGAGIFDYDRIHYDPVPWDQSDLEQRDPCREYAADGRDRCGIIVYTWVIIRAEQDRRAIICLGK